MLETQPLFSLPDVSGEQLNAHPLVLNEIIQRFKVDKAIVGVNIRPPATGRTDLLEIASVAIGPAHDLHTAEEINQYANGKLDDLHPQPLFLGLKNRASDYGNLGINLGNWEFREVVGLKQDGTMMRVVEADHDAFVRSGIKSGISQKIAEEVPYWRHTHVVVYPNQRLAQIHLDYEEAKKKLGTYWRPRDRRHYGLEDFAGDDLKDLSHLIRPQFMTREGEEGLRGNLKGSIEWMQRFIEEERLNITRITRRG